MRPLLKSLILRRVADAQKKYGRAVTVHEIGPLPVKSPGRELRRLRGKGLRRTYKGMFFVYKRPNSLEKWNYAPKNVEKVRAEVS